MGFIRAFIAIDLPQQTREDLQQQTARLREIIGEDMVRWVSLKNMHLTLKFLGDVPDTHLNFIKQSINQIADSAAGFDMQLSGLGSFPNSRLPRVLWAGIHAAAELKSLQQSIETAMAKLGYDKENRVFSPHLTLGRVKQNISPNEIQTIRGALEHTQLGKISTAGIDSLHLYKSDLQRGGSVYTKLHSAILQKS